jgi:hypothetical protein
MQLCGLPDGGRTPYDGQYLKDFDFERELADMTPDIEHAKRFPTFADALSYRNMVPASKPLRHDLQPNRPLSATNWEFRTLPDG